MPITAITFDLEGVLYSDAAERAAARLHRRTQEVLAYFSSRRIFLEPAEVEAAIQAVEAMFRCPGRENMIAQEIGQELNLLLLKKKLARPHCEELAELLSLAALRHPPTPIPGAADTLSLLAQRCKLGVVANTTLTQGREWAEILRLDGLSRHLTAQVFSDQILSAKPLERPFLYALALLETEPHATVHVSTDEMRDIRPAKSIGLKTILVAKGDAAESASKADACITGLSQIFGVLHRFENQT